MKGKPPFDVWMTVVVMALAAMLLLFVFFNRAEAAQVTATWEYPVDAVFTMTAVADQIESPPSEPVTVTYQVSGFRLYKNGKILCETNDPLTRTITCEDTVGLKIKTIGN